MPDYPIYLWERKPEWPAIVEAVTCPVCGAPPMSRCYDIGGMAGRFGAPPIYRVDWHTQRKYLALDKWREQEALDAVEKGKIEEGNSGEHPRDGAGGPPAQAGSGGGAAHRAPKKEKMVAADAAQKS